MYFSKNIESDISVGTWIRMFLYHVLLFHNIGYMNFTSFIFLWVNFRLHSHCFELPQEIESKVRPAHPHQTCVCVFWRAPLWQESCSHICFFEVLHFISLFKHLLTLIGRDERSSFMLFQTHQRFMRMHAHSSKHPRNVELVVLQIQFNSTYSIVLLHTV